MVCKIKQNAVSSLLIPTFCLFRLLRVLSSVFLMALSCGLLQAVPGVPKIKDGYNPATWMLDISTSQAESQLDIDFAGYYANSSLYQYV